MIYVTRKFTRAQARIESNNIDVFRFALSRNTTELNQTVIEANGKCDHSLVIIGLQTVTSIPSASHPPFSVQYVQQWEYCYDSIVGSLKYNSIERA